MYWAYGCPWYHCCSERCLIKNLHVVDEISFKLISFQIGLAIQVQFYLSH